MAPHIHLIYGQTCKTNFRMLTIKSLMWWRCVDNVFMVWQHGRESLQQFLGFLNNFHPRIKFTSEYSYTKVNFLDVEVKLEGNNIKTELKTVRHSTVSRGFLLPLHMAKV